MQREERVRNREREESGREKKERGREKERRVVKSKEGVWGGAGLLLPKEN